MKGIQNKMTLKELKKLVNSRWVHQIRAGERHRFIDISVIEVAGRFFVRQYKFSKRSWYQAFLEYSEGALKIGEVEVPVVAVVPSDLSTVNPMINRQYFKKMWIFYPLMRLTYDRAKHEASTLELIPKFSLE